MSAVCDIEWKCPGCGKDNKAQAYDDHCGRYHHSNVPAYFAAHLSWNAPCIGCGQYQLKEHEWQHRVSLPIVKITKDDKDYD